MNTSGQEEYPRVTRAIICPGSDSTSHYLHGRQSENRHVRILSTMSTWQDMGVMGPEPMSSDRLNPPQLITITTNKLRYRDALKTWADIIRSFTKVDAKAAE